MIVVDIHDAKSQLSKRGAVMRLLLDTRVFRWADAAYAPIWPA
jgi:hypothetical protein